MTPKHNVVKSLLPLVMPMDGLVLDPANARKHPEKNMTAIRSSLTMYGQRKPIVVQQTKDNQLIIRAGNGTYMAAREEGWTHIAAVIIEEDNTSATGFAIADNRTAELAEWDDTVLLQTLQALKDDGVGPQALGFEDWDLVPPDEAELVPHEESDSYNFTIKCRDESELARLQHHFGCERSSIHFNKFAEFVDV